MHTPLEQGDVRNLLWLSETLHRQSMTLTGELVHGLARWHWPGQVNAKRVDASRWLNVVGYEGAMPDYDGDESGEFELELDPMDETKLRYHPRMCISWATIPMAEAAIYAMRMPAFLDAVCELLDIAQALRKCTALIPDVLWHIGKRRVGQQHVPVYFACNFEAERRAILQHLNDPQLPEFGLILTSCRTPLVPGFPPPRQLKTIRLADLLSDSPMAEIDIEKLARVMSYQGSDLTKQAPPIHFDPLTNTLTLARIAKPWVLNGERQSKAIGYLANEIKKGRATVSASELIHASGGRSPSVLQLFEGGPWREYLHSPVRGQWRFAEH
jgi:hypothetical protein